MALVGGTNIRDATRRMFLKLVAPELAVKYSLAGRANKLSFRETAIYDILIRAVRMSGCSGTDKEIDATLGETLKHAKDYLSSRAHVPSEPRCVRPE